LLKTFNNDTFLKAYSSDNKAFGNNKALFDKFLGASRDRKLPITSLSFSPDSKIFAFGNGDGTIKLWSIEGREIKTFKGNNRVTSVSFSPDGKTLASAADNTVQIWSREGILLKTFDLKSGSYVQSVRFSPDGRTIALASWDNTVKILDTDGRELKIFKGHNSWVHDVNFSPDGQYIVSKDADGTAKFWSINGIELKTLKTGTVSLSPDGKILALGSTDGTVILKSLDLDELLNLGCGWLHGYLKNSSKVSESDKHLCDGIATEK
jgi:WD40 repeat protein